MGNLCGKEAKNDNFAGPGRTLGSAPPSKQARASVPARSATASGEGEARNAAGTAAEERVKRSTAKGKIGRDLDVQKGQTMNQTLQQASKDERRQREIDQMAKARTHA